MPRSPVPRSPGTASADPDPRRRCAAAGAVPVGEATAEGGCRPGRARHRWPHRDRHVGRQRLRRHRRAAAGLRDDLGDPLFFLGLLIVIGLAGWFAQYLRLSVDAALTVMIGLTSLAATWGVWTDRYEVDGTGLVGDQLGADGFSSSSRASLPAPPCPSPCCSTTTSNVRAWPAPRCPDAVLGRWCWVMAANDLIVLFLALETLSIAVYVMAAMHMRRSEARRPGSSTCSARSLGVPAVRHRPDLRRRGLHELDRDRRFPRAEPSGRERS